MVEEEVDAEKNEEAKEEDKEEAIEPKPKKVKQTKMVDEKKTETKMYEIIKTEYYKINPAAISMEEIKSFRQLESKMRQQDQEIRDRAARRNDLETFMYRIN